MSDALPVDRYAPLAQKTISFAALIEDRTQGFVGRQFVLDKLETFIRQATSGYFVVQGEPGIGKTALLAHLVQTRGCVHHFVVGSLGVTRAEQFLENVCAQLIVRYRLDHPAWLPPEATRDGLYLHTLLRQARQTLGAGEPLVLVVDALDEAEQRRATRGNVLLLPASLPDGVYVVCATRDVPDLALYVDQMYTYPLNADSAENHKDVLAYIEGFAQRARMAARLDEWSVDVPTFCQALLAKSEGNFMYLRHVLPAIKEGTFVHGTLDDLPQGLKAYYGRHWRQMREVDEEAWVRYHQRVLPILSTARQPVSAAQIADWTGLERARVLSVLRAWHEFLYDDPIQGVKHYRIYHASFQDFLAAKDEAQEINLNRAEDEIIVANLAMLGLAPDGTVLAGAESALLDYGRGLERLRTSIAGSAPERLGEFRTLEYRLLDNLERQRAYGSTETVRSERAQIVEGLNRLCEETGQKDCFNDLCRP